MDPSRKTSASEPTGVQAATNEDIHFDHDATITFAASGETDGGLLAAAAIALKGRDGSHINAAHLNISGAFGAINLGHNGHASNMHGNKGIGGGYGGTGYYDSDTYTPAPAGSPPGNDKGVGIRYSTPSIAGLQAGISFQPEAGALTATGAANDTNVMAIGLNFTGEFGGSSVTIGGGMVSKESGGASSMATEAWGIGTAITFGSTVLSLRYDVHGDNHANAATGKMVDSTDFGVGIDHTVGMMKFGVGYGSHTAPDKAIKGGKSADTSGTIIALGAQYDMGGGLKISGAINAGDVANKPVMSADEVPVVIGAEDLDDVGIGLRIALSF